MRFSRELLGLERRLADRARARCPVFSVRNSMRPALSSRDRLARRPSSRCRPSGSASGCGDRGRDRVDRRDPSCRASRSRVELEPVPLDLLDAGPRHRRSRRRPPCASWRARPWRTRARARSCRCRAAARRRADHLVGVLGVDAEAHRDVDASRRTWSNCVLGDELARLVDGVALLRIDRPRRASSYFLPMASLDSCGQLRASSSSRVRPLAACSSVDHVEAHRAGRAGDRSASRRRRRTRSCPGA